MSRDDDRLVYSSEHGVVGDARDRKPGRDTSRKGRARDRGRAAGKGDPQDGVARVRRDRKGRKGKTVTTVTGLPLSEAELRDLTAALKRRCGSGGSLVERVIEIQGDHVDTLVGELEARGLKVKRAGG
ncbi:MAG: translation initiation factor [Myxococcota bacterium]